MALPWRQALWLSSLLLLFRRWSGGGAASASPGLARPISPQPDWLTGRGVWGELRLGWDLAAAASAQTASGCWLALPTQCCGSSAQLSHRHAWLCISCSPPHARALTVWERRIEIAWWISKSIDRQIDRQRDFHRLISTWAMANYERICMSLEVWTYTHTPSYSHAWFFF